MTRSLSCIRLLLVASTFVCLCGGVAFAQEKVKTPFQAVVTADKAPVRSGGGSEMYIVGEVKQNDRVIVGEVLGEWYKIKPPAGVHSYISKGFVDAKGDGSSGTVNRRRSEVYAGSIDGVGDSYRMQVTLFPGDTVAILGEEGSYYKIKPPASAYVYLNSMYARPLTDAEIAGGKVKIDKKDDKTKADDKSKADDKAKADGKAKSDGNSAAKAPKTVTVTLTAEGTFHTGAEQFAMSRLPRMFELLAKTKSPPPIRIKPEPGVSNKVLADAVKAALNAGLSDVTPPLKDIEIDSKAGTTDGSVAKNDGGKADDGDDKSDSAKADGTDKDDKADEQDATAGIAKHDDLKQAEADLKNAFKKPVEDQPLDELKKRYEALAKVEGLTRREKALIDIRLKQIAHNAEAAAAISALDEAKQVLKDADAKAPEYTPPKRPTSFDYQGKLVASAVYNGQSLPRLYRLVDPANNRTIGYIDPTQVKDVTDHLGKDVGIVGELKFDRKQNISLFKVDSLHELNGEEDASKEASEEAGNDAN